MLLIISVALTLVIAGFISRIDWDPPAQNQIPFANYYDDNGVYDLRGIDFENAGAVIQYGKLYYPNQYLTPDQIGSVPPTVYDEKVGMKADYITQRFILLMPNNNHTYRLQTFGSSLKLYVNGKLYVQNGNPGTSWENTETEGRNVSIYVTPVDGKIELVAQTAEFEYYDDHAMRLAFWVTYPEADYTVGHISESKWVYLVIGVLLGSTILLLMMFLARRKMTQNLWFACICLAMGLHYGPIGQFDELHTLFPLISSNLSFLFESIGIPLMTGFMALYLNKVFPKVFNVIIRTIVIGVSFLYAALIVMIDPRIHTWLMQYYQLFYYASLLWVIVSLIRRLRKPEPEQYVALYGLIVFFAGVTYDFMRYFNLDNLLGLPEIDASGTMLLICYFAQMLSLFIGNNRAADNAREAERLAELEVSQLEKVNQIKTEFFGSVSHEMKTPLTVISVHIQRAQALMELGRESAEKKIKESFALAQDEIMRMSRLVDNARKLSSMQELGGRHAALDITDLLRTAAEAYRALLEKNGNQLTLELPDSLPPVSGSADAMVHLLSNLLSNANAHTKDGTIGVSAEHKGNILTYTVSDNGEGIPPEILPHVFERGVSGSGGSGLGLAICKEIIETHGGSISISSERGKGAKVSFTLPVYSEE